MKTIIPNLWFDKNAEEAVNFYTSLFPQSGTGSISYFGKEGFEHHGMPEGTVMTIEFEIYGKKFVALNGGPVFKFNESVSFYVYCESESQLDNLYNHLSRDGKINMPLGKYDWSDKYAWIRDKYGVSWQLDTDRINSSQRIVPCLLFANDKFAKVSEAINYYTSIFPDSKIMQQYLYPKSENIPAGSLLFVQFSISENIFNAISSTLNHDFDFNEAVSFIVPCGTKEEVDYFWDKLTKEGQESMCGWLKDKYGVSWQVVPTAIYKMFNDKNKSSRVISEIFKMRKLDLEILEKIFNE